MKSLLPLLALLALFGCEEQQAFRLEPTNRKTFAPTAALREGDVILLNVSGMSSNQRLRLHRCGPRCNTAEPVETWESTRINSGVPFSARIPRDGEYYFWVEDTAMVRGKYGAALVAAEANATANGFTVRYEPTLMVSVEGMQSNKTMEPTR